MFSRTRRRVLVSDLFFSFGVSLEGGWVGAPNPVEDHVAPTCVMVGSGRDRVDHGVDGNPTQRKGRRTRSILTFLSMEDRPEGKPNPTPIEKRREERGGTAAISLCLEPAREENGGGEKPKEILTRTIRVHERSKGISNPMGRMGEQKPKRKGSEHLLPSSYATHVDHVPTKRTHVDPTRTRVERRKNPTARTENDTTETMPAEETNEPSEILVHPLVRFNGSPTPDDGYDKQRSIRRRRLPRSSFRTMHERIEPGGTRTRMEAIA